MYGEEDFIYVNSTNYIYSLWAKRSKTDENIYHPLLLHLLDVAACADSVLEREPENTRVRMASILGMEWAKARPWLLLLIACHDLGKACPGFQLKWGNIKNKLKTQGFHIPRLIDTSVNHAFVSQLIVEKLLLGARWPEDLSVLCADAIGCHHGVRATPSQIQSLVGNRPGVDEEHWSNSWEELFRILRATFNITDNPVKNGLSGAEFMLLAGLTSFADWIGSDDKYFVYGTKDDCSTPEKWFEQRKKLAGKALDNIGWNKRISLTDTLQPFAKIFPKCSPPRALQKEVEKAVSSVPSPCVVLIEAPMGEGKTEAAFYAHLELQRKFGHRGMYMALPTKASGNEMFLRAFDFLKNFSKKRYIDLQLIHGAALLNEKFTKISIDQIYSDEDAGTIRAGQWFTHKKKALLSEYGVGTIDQALITILPVRHYFMRLWGLANRTVIFDEIHAYDGYTGTLLFHLIKWLRALGSSIVLLSATLPPEFRRRLAGAVGASLPEQEASYPRLTIFSDGKTEQKSFAAENSRRNELKIISFETDLNEIHKYVLENMPGSGFIGIIVNTVQRAQRLYELFGKGEIVTRDKSVIGKRIDEDIEINLFHARYPALERQKREDTVRGIYGKNNLQERKGRHILIATQVAEQSLDLDFDLLVTDLAPVDLILQRAGRLWRHKRKTRPFSQPFLCISGLKGDSPGSFGAPLWWNKVYTREDILLRTWQILKSRDKIILPDNIELLINEVYKGIVMPTDKDIQKRLEKAEIESVGEQGALKIMAHQAVIGLPEDGSWKDTNRFYMFDDDEPGVHLNLKAQTRLGRESVNVIPFFIRDKYNAALEPDFTKSKEWAMRSVALSRKGVVKKFQSKGIPEGWKKNLLLRNSYPMIFDDAGHWSEDQYVRMDKELGIVYTTKKEG